MHIRTSVYNVFSFLWSRHESSVGQLFLTAVHIIEVSVSASRSLTRRLA